jgi:hypothetical protein
MTPAVPSLKKFVLHTFLWLPACSVAWYFSAQYHSAVAGGLARMLVNLLTTGIVSAVERSGLDLVFVTTITVRHETGQTALLTPEINPLLYTYGLALFLALTLADRAKWWKIPLGIAVLLPFQAWGIALEVLAQCIQVGPDVSAQAGLSGWRMVAVGVGYQLGALIFPSLVPVVLWAASSQLISESIRGAQSRNAKPGPQLR